MAIHAEGFRPKRIKYSATFSDGSHLTRSSHRIYTHAWMRRIEKVTPQRSSNDYFPGQTSTLHGFSGSKELAEKALAAVTNRVDSNWRRVLCEVVAVEVAP